MPLKHIYNLTHAHVVNKTTNVLKRNIKFQGLYSYGRESGKMKLQKVQENQFNKKMALP